MKDELGDRMKDFYEDRTRYKLARRTNTIIRIDGKAFHTYTKGLERPFDVRIFKEQNLDTFNQMRFQFSSLITMTLAHTLGSMVTYKKWHLLLLHWQLQSLTN